MKGRRTEGRAASAETAPKRRASAVVCVGDIELDPTSHQVSRSGRALRLTPTERRLFEVLLSAPGRVFSRRELIDLIWLDGDIDPRTVDVHIGRLRRSLTRGWLLDPIESVISIGYKFSEDYAERHVAWSRLRKKKVQLKFADAAVSKR